MTWIEISCTCWCTFKACRGSSGADELKACAGSTGPDHGCPVGNGAGGCVKSTYIHTDMSLKPVQEALVPVMGAEQEMELEVVP